MPRLPQQGSAELRRRQRVHGRDEIQDIAAVRAGLRQRAQHPRRRAVHRPKSGRSRRSDRRVQGEIPGQDGLDLVRIHLRAARVDGRAGRREAKADRSHFRYC